MRLRDIRAVSLYSVVRPNQEARLLYRLPIVVFALLLTACDSDSEINVQYFTETWKTTLIGKSGEQIGYGYYVFDRLDSDGFGTSLWNVRGLGCLVRLF